MPIYGKVSGTWKSVTPSAKVSGTWRNVVAVWVKVSGTWRKAYQSLAATTTPTYVDGYEMAPGTPISGSAVCTPTGGVTPYSYEWEYVSGDTGLTLTNQYASVTSWSFTNSFSSFASKSAVYRCKVTDNAATVAYGDNVSIYLESSN